MVQRLLAAALAVCCIGLLAITVGMVFQGRPLSDYWAAAIFSVLLGVQTAYLFVAEPERERSKAWRVGYSAFSVFLSILGIVLLYFGMQELQQAFL